MRFKKRSYTINLLNCYTRVSNMTRQVRHSLQWSASIVCKRILKDPFFFFFLCETTALERETDRLACTLFSVYRIISEYEY